MTETTAPNAVWLVIASECDADYSIYIFDQAAYAYLIAKGPGSFMEQCYDTIEHFNLDSHGSILAALQEMRVNGQVLAGDFSFCAG